MKLREFGIALAVTGMVLFVGAGVAARFLPIGPALLIGVAIWFAASYLLVNTMKSKPAPSNVTRLNRAVRKTA